MTVQDVLSQGVGPATSLNGVTVDGAGTAVDLAVVRGSHTIVVSFTGDASEAVVALEGSHDGTIYAVLDEHDYASGGNGARTVKANVRYVRANLTHHVGSLTLKATLASS